MKQTKLPNLIFFAIFTTITILFWVGFSTYRVLATKPSPSIKPEVIAPFDPTLDTNTLSKLRGRVHFDQPISPTPPPL